MKNLRQEYDTRREFAKSLGSAELFEDLRILTAVLQKDEEFLKEGEAEARSKYEKHRTKSNPSESLLIGLAWDLMGFKDLLRDAIQLKGDCLELENSASLPNSQDQHKIKLNDLRKFLFSYTKQLFMKKRVAATHLMVFMIADERRNTKPYALPVRVSPYKSITDSKLRELAEDLRRVMVGLGMVVVGKYN